MHTQSELHAAEAKQRDAKRAADKQARLQHQIAVTREREAREKRRRARDEAEKKRRKAEARARKRLTAATAAAGGDDAQQQQKGAGSELAALERTLRAQTKADAEAERAQQLREAARSKRLTDLERQQKELEMEELARRGGAPSPSAGPLPLSPTAGAYFPNPLAIAAAVEKKRRIEAQIAAEKAAQALEDEARAAREAAAAKLKEQQELMERKEKYRMDKLVRAAAREQALKEGKEPPPAHPEDEMDGEGMDESAWRAYLKREKEEMARAMEGEKQKKMAEVAQMRLSMAKGSVCGAVLCCDVLFTGRRRKGHARVSNSAVCAVMLWLTSFNRCRCHVPLRCVQSGRSMRSGRRIARATAIGRVGSIGSSCHGSTPRATSSGATSCRPSWRSKANSGGKART